MILSLDTINKDCRARGEYLLENNKTHGLKTRKTKKIETAWRQSWMVPGSRCSWYHDSVCVGSQRQALTSRYICSTSRLLPFVIYYPLLWKPACCWLTALKVLELLIEDETAVIFLNAILSLFLLLFFFLSDIWLWISRIIFKHRNPDFFFFEFIVIWYLFFPFFNTKWTYIQNDFN